MDLNKKIIEVALSQYGVKEIKGKEDNPEVLKYFNILGLNGAALKDETAWCSASANWSYNFVNARLDKIRNW